MSTEAFVTLATNDAYALGALTLAQSIQQVGTKRNLVVLISNHLSDLIRLVFCSIEKKNEFSSLEKSFHEVILVDQLNANDGEHLERLSRPELEITFAKINCWLLDSDCVLFFGQLMICSRERNYLRHRIRVGRIVLTREFLSIDHRKKHSTN